MIEIVQNMIPEMFGLFFYCCCVVVELFTHFSKSSNVPGKN